MLYYPYFSFIQPAYQIVGGREHLRLLDQADSLRHSNLAEMLGTRDDEMIHMLRRMVEPYVSNFISRSATPKTTKPKTDEAESKPEE